MRTVRLIAAGVLVLATGCAQVKGWFGASAARDRPATTDRPAAAEPRAATRGRLLLSGGGRVPGKVIAEAARLTRGAPVKLLVVPLASSARDPGRATAELWEKAGFTDVEVLDTFEPAKAAAQIDAATFLWLTGGDQGRLVDRLLEDGMAERIRARFEAGALVGGTSAGATAVAELVLSGIGEDDEIQQGGVKTSAGLGLWSGVIVDASFVAKKRFNRLTAAVLDHSAYVGIGIDDGTGVVVEGTTFRVVGDGSVVVIDARRANVTSSRPGDASAATGVEMHVLAEGMTFDFARR